MSRRTVRTFATLGIIAGGGLILFSSARALASTPIIVGGETVATAEERRRFTAALPPEGRKYADAIIRAGVHEGVSPFILAAILRQESDFGRSLSPEGPAGVGALNRNGSRDLGLMQINSRAHARELAQIDWTKPELNIALGARIWRQGFEDLRQHGVEEPLLTRAAFAAYNAGVTAVLDSISAHRDPDAATATGSYGSTTIAYLDAYENRYPMPAAA